MSKATESKLNNLHGAVADVLTTQVLHQDAETAFDEDGEMVETGDMIYTASPALLAAAMKFLKDNDITADVEQDENLGNLRDALTKKQQYSRLSAVK